LNNGYYENSEENFKQALKFYECEYTRSELFELLQNGNIAQKQIAVLKLEEINSKEEARILVSNLTGQDGKIREAVSMKLCEFMNNKKFLPYFQNSENYPVFLDAVTDINGNICRNIIASIENLKNDEDFCTYFCPALAELTLNLIEAVEKTVFCGDGNYKVNKQAFKLYWCLETIYEFCDKMNFEKLKEIIIRASKIGEYTIREKTAKILTRGFEDAQLQEIKICLQNDPNYYVRRF